MTSKTAKESNSASVSVADAAVDKLEVWCAVCQKTMKLVTGENYVHGWYACEQQDSPCASHAVIISAALESSTQTAGKAGDGEDSGAKLSARTPKDLTERNTVHAVHEPRAEVSASSPSPRPEPTQTQEGVRREGRKR